MCEVEGPDRRHILAGVVAAAGLAGLGSPAAAQTKAVYVCPPCGCPADGREFDAPGLCPSCGMTLILKSALPAAAQAPRLKVAILVFEGVQIIDFTGPYEVFGQAGYEVFTVGAAKTPLHTAMGLMITPAFTFAEHPQPDILVIPGGNIHNAMHDKPTLDWIAARSVGTRATMSVCNGALILAATGLLDGLTATTFHGALDSLKTQFPRITVVEDKRFVDNGRFITTAGLSSGIDGAMHVVSRQEGQLDAQLVARNLEYDWKEDSTYARGALADYPIDAIFGTRLRLVLPAGTGRLEKSAGDRKQWEVSWLLDTPATGEAVAADIESGIAARTPLRAEKQDTPSPQRNWRFVDPRGRAWGMKLDVAAAGSMKRVRMAAILVK